MVEVGVILMQNVSTMREVSDVNVVKDFMVTDLCAKILTNAQWVYQNVVRWQHALKHEVDMNASVSKESILTRFTLFGAV